MSMEDEDFSSSHLGTKDHWDSVYHREIQVFRETEGEEVGEVWFEETCGDDIYEWIVDCISEHFDCVDVKCLDLGCGNGVLLSSLYDLGVTNLCGIDYSADALILSRLVSSKHSDIIFKESVEEESQNQSCPPRDGPGITLRLMNILAPALDIGIFDVVIDKGTLDAIVLSKDAVERGSLQKQYVTYINSITHKNSIFIITSCNHTKEELKSLFNRQQQFQYQSSYAYPEFSYGGHQGSAVVS